ncbi:MAG: cell division protein ZapA [Proteobacteria bacterium]|nr:cell division protein ZapA [Pseudomonadota bacterium]
MAQVTVRINNRNYQVGCEDGQESHVAKLAEYIDGKVAELASQVGQVGDARLLAMASLLIADELSEAYDEAHELHTDSAVNADIPDPQLTKAVAEARGSAQAADAKLTSTLSRADQVAGRLEALTTSIEALTHRLQRA